MPDLPLTAGRVPSGSLPVVVKPLRWGQIALGAVAIGSLVLVGELVGQSQNVQWAQIPAYLIDPTIFLASY